MIYPLLLFLSFFHPMEQKIDRINVDSFDNPLKDSWEGRREGHESIYKIDLVDENSYLSAKSKNSDNFIIKVIKVDIVKYPYLNWKWRANVLPEKGDESVKEFCDEAASIAVVFNKSKWRPKSLKYSWSTTLKKRTFTVSPYSMWPARSDIFIMESGENHIGQWKTEKVNVLEHYKRLYKKKHVKSKLVEAIVIMTDSDNTKTAAEADYDDIYFSCE